MQVFQRFCLYCTLFFVVILSGISQAQFKIPGLGSSSPKDDNQVLDQFVGGLLQQDLPLVLNANDAFPTVPDSDLLGGPFRGQALPITVDALTKPLAPGDYVIPMTFFCSEYSVHRPGAGTAYTLAPAKGSSAKAISTFLWRGMLSGKSPQELHVISWAIQGSVPYDKMPLKYQKTIDQLVPDMKGQLNGQGFTKVENAWNDQVNGKGIKFVHIKTHSDLSLEAVLARLGPVGRLALDGERITSTFSAGYASDQMREQTLFAGQGSRLPPLPAANGPWSVRVPGIAYMRFIVHSGNLQGDNIMQIRILKPRSTAQTNSVNPHYELAGYQMPTAAQAPSLVDLFGGSVNQATLSSCISRTYNTGLVACEAGAITVGGITGYSIGTGAQAPIMTPSVPLPISPPLPIQTAGQVTVKITKLIYNKIIFPYQKGLIDHALCVFFGAKITDAGGNSVEASPRYRWKQTVYTNNPPPSTNKLGKPCEVGRWSNGRGIGGFTDPCGDDISKGDPSTDSPPFYRSSRPLDWEADWHTKFPEYGYLFRDIPRRVFNDAPGSDFPLDFYFHATTRLLLDGDEAHPLAQVDWGFSRVGEASIRQEPFIVTAGSAAATVDNTAPQVSSDDPDTATYFCDVPRLFEMSNGGLDLNDTPPRKPQLYTRSPGYVFNSSK